MIIDKYEIELYMGIVHTGKMMKVDIKHNSRKLSNLMHEKKFGYIKFNQIELLKDLCM
jgi:hypothetical protein